MEGFLEPMLKITHSYYSPGGFFFVLYLFLKSLFDVFPNQAVDLNWNQIHQKGT